MSNLRNNLDLEGYVGKMAAAAPRSSTDLPLPRSGVMGELSVEYLQDTVWAALLSLWKRAGGGPYVAARPLPDVLSIPAECR